MEEFRIQENSSEISILQRVSGENIVHREIVMKFSVKQAKLNLGNDGNSTLIGAGDGYKEAGQKKDSARKFVLNVKEAEC